MASYRDYNPSVWTGGISQQEFNALFGTVGGQPVINWTTQGEYAPGSTFKVTSTAAAVADGYPLNGLYSCPASVSIGGHNFVNDGEPNLGDMTFATALIQSCDTVYYNLGYDMYLTDNARELVKSPDAPVQKMQQMELAWGFGREHRHRPARRVDRYHPHQAVAVLPVEGQCLHRSGLVQERPRVRQLRAADRVPGLPERVGGDRARRPSPRSARAT